VKEADAETSRWQSERARQEEAGEEGLVSNVVVGAKMTLE